MGVGDTPRPGPRRPAGSGGGVSGRVPATAGTPSSQHGDRTRAPGDSRPSVRRFPTRARRRAATSHTQVEPVSRKHSTGKHGPGHTGRLPGASASREPGHLRSARQPRGWVSGSERTTPPTRVIGAGRRGPRPRPSCRPPTPAPFGAKPWETEGKRAQLSLTSARACGTRLQSLGQGWPPPQPRPRRARRPGRAPRSSRQLLLQPRLLLKSVTG